MITPNMNQSVPSADSADNLLVKHVVGNKTDTIAGDSLVALIKQILVAVNEAMQLRVEQSATGTIEEDGMVNFGIGLMDIDTGAIASGSIDITGISAVLDISTGGAAFAPVGTQPTFAKANGLVSVDYRFLAAEWANGDMYKLVVSGIECTVGADTAYVPALTWSGTLQEGLNVEGKIDTIDTVVDAIQVDIGDPSARTNLQSLLALLGNPDTAGKTIYEAIKNIRETAIDGSSLPIANTLSDILHKDGSYTFDNTTDSLEALRDAINAIQTDLGDPSARTNLQTVIAMLGNPDAAGKSLYDNLGDFVGQTNLQSLLAALGIPDVAAKPLYTCLVTDRLDHATFGLSAIQVQVDDIQDKIDGTDATATAYRREKGVLQCEEFSVTDAANAGVTTFATITTQGCLIKSIVLHSDGATTADLTSAAIKGGAGQVVEFISAASAAKANIDAADEQVNYTGAVWLPATQTLAIDLQGTGATTVDFTIVVEYVASADGGYLA